MNDRPDIDKIADRCEEIAAHMLTIGNVLRKLAVAVGLCPTCQHPVSWHLEPGAQRIDPVPTLQTSRCLAPHGCTCVETPESIMSAAA